MAPRKTTRKKRSTRGKSSGRSTSAVITVAAIVAIGATALWATAQNKSPTASVSHLLQNAISSPSRPSNATTSSPTHRPVAEPVQTALIEKPQIQVQARPIAPVIAQSSVQKPPLSLSKPASSSQTSQIKSVPLKSSQIEPKPAPAVTLALPPVSKTAPEDNSRHANGSFKVPKVIIARQPLVIREKAWDQAKKIGSVEKGREMRSYAKVGRWHRVVVPSTNIIGWVQEDQLMFKNRQDNKPLRANLSKQQLLTTGSVAQRPIERKPQEKAPHKKPNNKELVAPHYPPLPVGKN